MAVRAPQTKETMDQISDQDGADAHGPLAGVPVALLLCLTSAALSASATAIVFLGPEAWPGLAHAKWVAGIGYGLSFTGALLGLLHLRRANASQQRALMFGVSLVVIVVSGLAALSIPL